MKINKDTKRTEKSEIIEQMPMACADEKTAVEFFEKRLWNGTPKCACCQSTNVYQMRDGKTGERNKRFLWRCHDCKKQFTVRIGTVLEESRLPLRHWAYAFWRASTSKKGVSAKEIQRQCQISYEGALFLMHRIRFAMTSDLSKPSKVDGTVEVDETFVGGKVRPGNKEKPGTRTRGRKFGKDSKHVPVVAMVQRNGQVRSKVIVNVNHNNLHRFINRHVSRTATVNTDGFAPYHDILYSFARHDVVNHSAKEYARHNPDGTVSHTNTAESFFSLLKRGLHGIYHSVSKEHLQRYAGEFDFRWNGRNLNDGERTVLAIEGAKGKRLTYENYVA